MTHRLALPLLVLGALGCAQPPQVEPRHPPVSLLSEAHWVPGPIRADARGFQPDCAALVPYKWQPPIIRPKADHWVMPELGHMRIQFVLDLEALIDDTGHVCDARLLKRMHPATRRIDEGVRDAILKSRFQPATFGNVPVAVVLRIRVKLELG
jgi:hypothetical protein